MDAMAAIAEVILTVDDRVVGTISATPNGQYHVKTKGLVPKIDGIAGTSYNDAWSKVAERVRSGVFQRPQNRSILLTNKEKIFS